MLVRTNTLNTLRYDPALCIGCGMCNMVCPHGVFAPNGRIAKLVGAADCIECGACQLNCPTGAITVDSGVGCAAAYIHAALTGGEPTCGCDDGGCDTSSKAKCC